MKTVNSYQMRQIELQAIRDFGINELILMENAGRAVAEAAETLFAARDIPKEKKIYIFCGAGNNGGDGLVAARHLHNKRFIPEVILVKSPELFKDVSFANFSILDKLGIKKGVFGPSTELRECGLIVDALLGTGIKGGVREPYEGAIELINASGLPVVSVDVPSGLCADTGKVLDHAVRADITVTMGIAKTGLVSKNAKDYVGEIIVADIGLPKELL